MRFALKKFDKNVLFGRIQTSGLGAQETNCSFLKSARWHRNAKNFTFICSLRIETVMEAMKGGRLVIIKTLAVQIA